MGFHPESDDSVIGAVLCGGASRRMGRDKALVTVEGVAMARRMVERMIEAGCSDVVAVGGDALGLADAGIEYLADRHPAQGPLGGILTALSIGAPCLVVACDLPRLGSASLIEVVAALGSHAAAMAHSDRPEPLCAVWSERAAWPLQRHFDDGERAVHRAIVDLDIAWVQLPAGELRNVNTPEDLRTL
jgi:molybdenum cofactor guanylyltransferase